MGPVSPRQRPAHGRRSGERRLATPHGPVYAIHLLRSLHSTVQPVTQDSYTRVCDYNGMDEQRYRELFPEDDEEEAPADALPASPRLRKVAIAIYILILICVIGGLLLSMVWSGIVADRWSVPFPEPFSF